MNTQVTTQRLRGLWRPASGGVKRLSTLAAILFLGMAAVFAAPPAWENPTGLANTMTIHAQVQLADTSLITDAGSMLAGFKDGELRGVIDIISGPAGQQFQLAVGSNLTSEPGFTFKAYNAATDEVIDLTETLDFVADDTVGLLFDPILLTQYTGPLAVGAASPGPAAGLDTDAATVADLIGVDEGTIQVFSVTATGGIPPYTYAWTLNANPVGTDSATFSYSPAFDAVAHPAMDDGGKILICTITDSTAATATATWSDMVTEDVDQLPPAPTVSVLPASPTTTDALMVNATSVDPDGDAVTFSVVWSMGATTYTGTPLPPTETTKGDVWTVEVTAETDPYGTGTVSSAATTDSATIVNTPPTAVDSGPISVVKNTTGYDLTVTGNDPDVADGIDTLTFEIVTGPANGTLASFNGATGQATYQPDTDFLGADSFTFRVSDDGGATWSAEGTVTLDVFEPYVMNLSVTGAGVSDLSLGVAGGATDVADPGIDVLSPPVVAERGDVRLISPGDEERLSVDMRPELDGARFFLEIRPDLLGAGTDPDVVITFEDEPPVGYNWHVWELDPFTMSVVPGSGVPIAQFDTLTVPAADPQTPQYYVIGTPSSPTIASVSPSVGPVGASTTVTLTGTDFLAGASVRVAFGTPPAADLTVGPGGAGAGYDYGAIQDAVNAANPGDVIVVDAGTYVEDLVIAKDDLELVGAGPGQSVIKGVQMTASTQWPLAQPNIGITGDGVSIHGFTIQGPDPAVDHYSSGIVVEAANVSLYDNRLEVTNAANLADISQGFQTVQNADISGLHVFDNVFTSHGSGVAGYEAMYLNLTPGTGIVIERNTFRGVQLRGVTTEASNVLVDNNTFETSLDAAGTFAAGKSLQAVNLMDGSGSGATIQNVIISNNTIRGTAGGGFRQGVRTGSVGQTLVDVDILANTFANCGTGVQNRGTAGGVLVTGNNFDAGIFGVQNDDTGVTLDATSNWWGDASGPRPTGSGADISADVDASAPTGAPLAAGSTVVTVVSSTEMIITTPPIPRWGAADITVTNADGGTVTATEAFAYNTPPTADGNGPYSIGLCNGHTFDAVASDPGDVSDSLTYEWDLDNNGTFETTTADTAATEANPWELTLTYAELGSLPAGTYTMGLRVTDTFSQSDTTTFTVDITNTDPIADANGPYHIDLGDSLVLDASGSSDPDACDTILQYAWDLDNDGNYDDVVGSSPNPPTVPWAMLVALGIDQANVAYPVSLRVTDGNGVQVVDGTTLNIYENRPFPAFTFNPTNPAPITAVAFDATGTTHGRDGSPAPVANVLYEWDFNFDGATFVTRAVGETVTYFFPTYKVYTVALRVTDDNGVQAVVQHTLTVNGGNTAPSVTDTGGPYAMTAGESLTFTGTAEDPEEALGDAVVSYEWYIDHDNDGTADVLLATGANPTVGWADLLAAGVDNTTVFGPALQLDLTVEDIFGNSATGTTTLTITYDAPIADAGTAYEPTILSDLTLDGSGSTGSCLVDYVWTVDHDNDGGTADIVLAAGVNPLVPASVVDSIVEVENVAIDLTLTVTDCIGATDAAVGTLEVVNEPGTGDAWTFTLNVAFGSELDLVIGVAPEATENADAIDVVDGGPLADGSHTVLHTPNGGPSLQQAITNSDVDGNSTTDYADWILEVTAGTNDTCLIWWDETAVPAEGMWLIDLGNPGSVPEADGRIPAGAERIDMSDAGPGLITVPAGDTRYYRVVFGAIEVDVDVVVGWNLVSLPVEPLVSTDIDDVIPGYLAGSNWVWDPAAGAYQAADNVHGLPGYWAYFDSAQTITVRGVRINDRNYLLTPGEAWHLVGFEAERVLEDNVDIFMPAFAFDSGTQAYEEVTPGDTVPAGTALWFFVIQETVLNPTP